MLRRKRKNMAKKNTDKQEQDMIAANDPAKRSDVETSDNDFPGYPHYPKTEDIMDGRSDAERVSVDVENLPNFHNATTAHRLNSGTESERTTGSTPIEAEMESDLGIEMGTEADVTPDEKKLLDDDMYYPTPDEDRLRQARLDDTDFDGEPLNEQSFGAGQAESGSDLDMETATEETASDASGQGEEDEENQYWSLGSAENDNIVEGTP
jgi:hypothetical protein